MPYSDEIIKPELETFVELYDITVGTKEPVRTTNYEKTLTWQFNDYTPAPISRGSFRFDKELKATHVKINAPLVTPFLEYIANSPIEPVRVVITRVFLFDTNFYKVLFDGEVLGVTMQGGLKDDAGRVVGIAQVDCESSSKVFRDQLPLPIHSAFCNHQLYDDG